MVDNQHRLIKGYRELTPVEISQMNHAKEVEQDLLKWMDELSSMNTADPRWLALAKTKLQFGFMALGRSIARPDGY